MPFIVSWKDNIKPAVSDAMVCQIDLFSSFAAMLNKPLAETDGSDSYNVLDALLGKSGKGRATLVEQGGALAIVKDNWKYIEPNDGEKVDKNVNIELGNDLLVQLYNLKDDIGEKVNLASKYPGKVKELSAELERMKSKGK